MPDTTPELTQLLDSCAATIGHVASSIWGGNLSPAQVNQLVHALIRATEATIELTDGLICDIEVPFTKTPAGVEHLPDGLAHLHQSNHELRRSISALQAYCAGRQVGEPGPA